MRRFLLFLIATAASGQTLWHEPSPSSVAAPKPPYTFLREDLSGTQPKVFVRDAGGSTWNVKFGYEVHNESFCWRIVQACGYFAEPSFYVAEGQFAGLRPLKRRSDSIKPDGHFTAARFQYRDPELKFLKDRNWRWDRPPFAGTKELSGLKILIMFFSNWDNKDARVGRGGPNTGEFEEKGKRIAAFTDWGSGMGKWGSKPGTNSNWNCGDFTAQTPHFVTKIEQNRVFFGWEGAIHDGFRSIPAAHVVWLMGHLGKIPDAQIREALKSAGGTDAEVDCFATALGARIEQLRAAAAH
jgi:hypothetical protein